MELAEIELNDFHVETLFVENDIVYEVELWKNENSSIEVYPFCDHSWPS